MSDQGISEEELEKLLMESGMDDDDEQLIIDAPEVEASNSSEQPVNKASSEGEKTMSQAEIDALLASLGGSDD